MKIGDKIYTPTMHGLIEIIEEFTIEKIGPNGIYEARNAIGDTLTFDGEAFGHDIFKSRDIEREKTEMFAKKLAEKQSNFKGEKVKPIYEELFGEG